MRSWAQTVNPTGGGGSVPTVGNVQIGPDFGEVNKPAAGAHVELSNVGMAGNVTAGAHVVLSALAMSGGVSAGVHLDAASNYTSNVTAGAHVAIPTVGFAGNVGVGSHVAIPSTAFAGGISAGTHLAGTYLGAPVLSTNVPALDGPSAGTVCTIPVTAGNILVGDLMVAFTACSNVATTLTAPSGWTKIRQRVDGTGTTGTAIAAFWKIADAADAAAASFDFVVSNAYFGVIHLITGFDSTTPINVSNDSGGSATNPVTASVTTTAANCLLLIACAQSSIALDLTYTPPSNYTEIRECNGAGIAGAHGLDGCVDYRYQSATGASGAQTITSTALVASSYSTITLAIAPGVLTLVS